MPAPPPPDWAAIRVRYETTADPVADICADAGITRKALAARRSKESWRRQFPRPFPAGRRASLAPSEAPAASRARRAPSASPDASGPAPSTASAQTTFNERVAPSASAPPPSQPGATPPALAITLDGLRAILVRLVAATSLKLEQLERRMSQDLADDTAGKLTTADHEREAKAIGALIDNISKVREIATDLDANANGGKSAPTAELADEADRRRREFADRLRKIVGAATERA